MSPERTRWPNTTRRQASPVPSAATADQTWWLGGNEDPTYTSIALGTLDSPLPSVAQRHIYVGSKADWYVIADDLPQEHQY